MRLDDPDVFTAAYERHQRGVYGAAFGVLGDAARAQDVMQDVFLQLWCTPEKFDPQRGHLGGYLRLMARSRAVDLWRETQAAGRAADRLELVVARQERSPDGHPGPMAELEHDRSAMREALRRLPPAQREAIVLAYWGGLTAEQIAARSDVPLGTAKGRVRLGLARLLAHFDTTRPPQDGRAPLPTAA